MPTRKSTISSNDKTLSLTSAQTATATELRQAYQQLFKRPPPKRASERFLRGNVCWAIEAIALDKDPIQWRATLIKQLQATVAQQSGQPILSPGTRLVREWQGNVHEVAVTESGFTWNAQTFSSLSAVANAITGQKRSGPRFFGLHRQQET